MERLSQVTTLKINGGTHEGMSGKHNEDNYGLFAWQLGNEKIMHLGVVADGVGGQIAGEIASRITIETVGTYFDNQETVNNFSGHLEQSILAANEAVYNAGLENPDYKGMSTTIAMAAIIDNNLYTSHVGDSRIYLLRDGQLKQISIDHTWAQEAIEAGLLTREQAKTHPNRNVIKRHLGGKLQIEVDHRLAFTPGQSNEEAHENQGMALKPGDTILICSDGLTDMISDEAVLESLNNHFQDLPTAIAELIDKANRAGGRDNITVVLMQVPSSTAVPVTTTLIDQAAYTGPVEPTLITSAPKTISQSKPAAAAAATQAAASQPRVAQPSSEKRRSKGLPILLIIIIGIILLIILAVGGYFLFGDRLNPSPTPTLNAEPTTVQNTPLPTNTPGSPATAAFLETAASSTESSQDPNTAGTEEAAPTLRATLTPSITPTRTPVPPPLSTATSPSTATSSATEIPTDQPQATQPPATNPPPATFTPRPDPTITPNPTPTPSLGSE